jgi:hypothetical protein
MNEIIIILIAYELRFVESKACVCDSFFSSENGQIIGQVKQYALYPAVIYAVSF